MFSFFTLTADKTGKTPKYWLCFKIAKYFVVLLCLLLLPVNQLFYHIEDDFTPAYKTPEDNTSDHTPVEPTSNKTTPVEPTSSKTTPVEPTSNKTTPVEPTSSETTTIEPTTPKHKNASAGNGTTDNMRGSFRDFEHETTTNTPLPCATAATVNTVTTGERYLIINNLSTSNEMNICITTINGGVVNETTVGGTTVGVTTVGGATVDRIRVSEITLDETSDRTTVIETTTDTPVTFYWPSTKANKRKVRTLLKNYRGILDKDMTTDGLYKENPFFRVKRFTKFRTSSDESDSESKTRLSDLLILYPCCTTVLIILGMEMCGQMLKDPITKWTNIFLKFLCIGLGILTFVVSLLAAMRSVQLIMIFICVLSITFLILEVVDLIFLFRT